jgi:thiol-disulfide isomerase/thioredoxin
VQVFEADERQDAPEFGGTLTDGEAWSSTEHADEVMVVNFWYAACPPCRVEAPLLAELATELDGDVTFIGVNTRDTAPSAQAFDERFGIPYESILDEQDNGVQLAFAGSVTPNAVPTTLVIGSDGTIAARFSGAISDTGVLRTVLLDELG